MGLAERIAEQVPKLPAELKQLLDAELTAGNAIIEVEHLRGADQGKVALILERPFHGLRTSIPPSLVYRETPANDRRIFRYLSADEQFSLAYVKFKPMVLQKITGPPPPPTPEEMIARAEKREKERVAARTARIAEENRAVEAARASRDRPQSAGPDTRKPADRFIASMTMTFDMWHDGLGYDLDALREIPPSEIATIETILISHQPRDWRDIEALAVIDSARARKTIEAALKDRDPNVRREAAKYAGEKVDPASREKLILKGLETDQFFEGLSAVLDDVEEFHPPSVIDALLRGALNRDGEIATHFAAMLFFLHGKAKEAFDWDHRPFFLRFNTTDRAERKAAFRDLCETIGVDVTKYLRA